MLLVTENNRYLSDSFKTLAELCDVVEKSPDEARGDVIRREIATGRFDLVVYDTFRPEVAPEANALYFGVLPPGKEYEPAKEIDNPVILDVNVAHPLMQYVRDMTTVVIISKAVTCELPSDSTALVESDKGPIAFVAPRNGFVDAVISFSLLDGTKFNTNWQLKTSFPLFLYNTLKTLGNASETTGGDIHRPDQPVEIRADSLAQSVDVHGPDGTKLQTIKRSLNGTFVFDKARQTGIYQVKWAGDQSASFAVNIFDPRESNLAPRGRVPDNVSEKEADAYKIKIGLTAVKASAGPPAPSRTRGGRSPSSCSRWSLLEWYVYNRRVYI